jgi:hypothetical protein
MHAGEPRRFSVLIMIRRHGSTTARVHGGGGAGRAQQQPRRRWRAVQAARRPQCAVHNSQHRAAAMPLPLLPAIAVVLMGSTPPVPTVAVGMRTYAGRYTAASREFLGVEYAQQPVGNLRWFPAQPPLPLSAPVTLDAGSTFGPMCNQDWQFRPNAGGIPLAPNPDGSFQRFNEVRRVNTLTNPVIMQPGVRPGLTLRADVVHSRAWCSISTHRGTRRNYRRCLCWCSATAAGTRMVPARWAGRCFSTAATRCARPPTSRSPSTTGWRCWAISRTRPLRAKEMDRWGCDGPFQNAPPFFMTAHKFANVSYIL